ncbi:MAG: restriction endonuclease [Candidatus Altiarchaeota archaeon]
MKPSDFEDDASKLLFELGYEVESISVAGKCLKFRANTRRGKLDEKTLVVFYFRAGKIGDPVLKGIMKEVKKNNYAKALVFSMSDYTREAVAYSQKNPVELIDREGYRRLCVKHGLVAGEAGEQERLSVYESAFQPGLTVEDARRIFTSHRRRMFNYFGGYVEDVPEVAGRFVPAAKVSTTLEGKTKSLLISLTTGCLYYTRRDVIRKKRVLEEGEFYGLFKNLANNEIMLLGEVVRKTEVQMSKLELDIAAAEKLKILMRLKSRKLIDVVNKKEPTVYSNMNIPDLRDERFNIEDYYESTKNLRIVFETDEIKHEIKELTRKLALFFGEDTIFEKVTYVPYYHGVFIDRKSRLRREKITALKEKKTDG